MIKSIFVLLAFITPPIMNPDLQQIETAAHGLLYMSESDYPLDLVVLDGISGNIEEKIKGLNLSSQGPVEKVSLDYFFRNMVRSGPDAPTEQKESARRFQVLGQLLKEKLHDVQVYRIGSIQVTAYIIGRLSDGSYAGLKTTVIET
jgi:hypothetical protein